MRQYVLHLVFSIGIALNVSAVCAYTGYGAGNDSCGTWVEARRTGKFYIMGNWMLGYITSYGAYSGKELKRGDSHAFSVWMDNYCQQHPLDEFETGVQHLIKTLKTK